MTPFPHFDLLHDPALDLVDPFREYLIHKLKEVAESHGPDLTFDEFSQATGVKYRSLLNKFGRWSDLRRAAGLPPHGKRRGWSLYTREEIFDAFQQAVAELGEHITLFEFTRHSGISKSPILHHYGGFLELRRLAGLTSKPRRFPHYSDDQLLQHFHQVAEKLGRIPTGAEFNRLAPVSMNTLYSRFGNKGEIERACKRFLKRRRSESQQPPPRGRTRGRADASAPN